jgi:alkylhydroperoxidase family enzyme
MKRLDSQIHQRRPQEATLVMPRINAVDPATLDGEPAELAKDPFYGVLAHRPEILEAWFRLDKVFFGPSSALPNELKEEGRRALSQGAGCKLCASFGTPKPDNSDRRESLAAAFADMVVQDHQSISDATFDVLREEFSDEEIVELVSWLCFKLGSNVFGSLMRLAPGTDDQIRAYAEFVATG